MKKRLFFIFLLITISSVSLLFTNMFQKAKINTFSELIVALDKGQVKSLSVSPPSEFCGKLVFGEKFKIIGKTDKTVSDSLEKAALRFGTKFHFRNNYKKKATEIWEKYVSDIVWLILAFGIAYIWPWSLNKGQTFKKNNKEKSTNNRLIQVPDQSYEDTEFFEIAGASECRENLTVVLSFLKNPNYSRRLGAYCPRGILLSGEPGTGKTMIARALAREARVPFIYVSGSEFVEMYIGVGARRIRELFKRARESSPCVIFVDEIDTLAGARSAGNEPSGGDNEHDQTLNQLLVEMDGFKPTDNVIVIAATNRPDMLDSAITRPGRLGHHVWMGTSTALGRGEILQTHWVKKNIFAVETVDWENLGEMTIDMSGAELKAIINEIVLQLRRSSRADVYSEDFEKIIVEEQEGQSILTSATTDQITHLSYSNAGYLIVSLMLGCGDLYEIGISPRTSSYEDTEGGLVMDLYEVRDEDNCPSAYELLKDSVVLMGGVVVQEIVFGEIGGYADFSLMEIVLLFYDLLHEYNLICYEDENELSMETKNEYKKVIGYLIITNYDTALEIIANNVNMLHCIAKVLIEYEVAEADIIETLIFRKIFN